MHHTTFLPWRLEAKFQIDLYTRETLKNLLYNLVLFSNLGFLWGLVKVKEQCIFQTLLLLHFWLRNQRGTILKTWMKMFPPSSSIQPLHWELEIKKLLNDLFACYLSKFLPPMTIIFTYAESRLDRVLLKTSWYSNSLWFIGSGTRANMHPMIRVLLTTNPHQNDLDDVCDCRW